MPQGPGTQGKGGDSSHCFQITSSSHSPKLRIPGLNAHFVLMKPGVGLHGLYRTCLCGEHIMTLLTIGLLALAVLG